MVWPTLGSRTTKEQNRKRSYHACGEDQRMAWMDSIKRWTGLPVEESVRMTEDRDKRIKVRP